jgi:hypothetical protein
MNKDVFLVETEIEIHCDQCQEPIHWHMETCPVCKQDYAETDQYCHPRESVGEVIECLHCNSSFLMTRWGELKPEDEYVDYAELEVNGKD